ncbi:MAG: site-specific tyrosine recombinase XerD [Flavobacteriaceae bacterium]
MRWETAIQDFLQYLKIERGMATHTLQSYRMDLLALERFLANYKIEESPINCSAETLQAFIYESAKELKPSSQSRRLSGLKSFFDFLIFENYRKTHPTLLIESPKQGRYLPTVLSVEEIDRMIAQIDLEHPQGYRNHAIIEMLYGCGLRVSELVDLKLSQLFFTEKLVRIQGKGNKQRLVPLGRVCRETLHIYFENSRSQQKINPAFSDTVFLNRNGKQLTRAMIFTVVKTLAERAEIGKNVSPHTFRHSFATHLLENGADLPSVQMLLGHESITTTEVYTHLSTQHLQQVMLNHHPHGKIS